MNEHRHEHTVTSMCRILRVARAGFYAWMHEPVSDHAQKDARLLDLIREFDAGETLPGPHLRSDEEILAWGRTTGMLREVEKLFQVSATFF